MTKETKIDPPTAGRNGKKNSDTTTTQDTDITSESNASNRVQGHDQGGHERRGRNQRC